MPDSSDRPQEYDAVLGGHTPIPEGRAILGGIEGVKSRLASAIEEQRIAALSESLKYGDAGLDLVIGALQDESIQVEKTAYLLLRERAVTELGRSADPKVKQALKAYNPWDFCECLSILGGHTNGIKSLAISPDGQTLVSGGYRTLKIWNLQTGELKKTMSAHLSHVYAVAISPDGQAIVSGGYKNLKTWNIETGELKKVRNHISGKVNALAIDRNRGKEPDWQTIFSGGIDKNTYIWFLDSKFWRTGLRSCHNKHSQAINAVAISPDGKTLVSGSDDKTIKLWNIVTGSMFYNWNAIRTITGHLEAVKALAISPDGQILVSGSADNTIKIWQLATGELLGTLEEHTKSVNAVAISPDGKIMISGSSDKSLKIWRLATGELIKTLKEHTKGINAVAITPDGRTIVSGSADNTIKLWGVS
ncbi:MAG: WD40 repeat domain-containing protein [Oscillatoriaceae cyanobacterium Prado104]|jgi:WD40 repeat protein|nr:WD40 repeat domain-containing protein [Oscillatoriaceae cyanobacterium Prado104]